MNKKWILSAVLLLAELGCTSPKESGIKVIVGARLNQIEYSVLIIQEGKIRAAGPQSAVPVPKGSEVIRGIGMSIEPLPGGAPVAAGQPANLVLKGSTQRMMRDGEWVSSSPN